jgi:hypothetical protein
LVFSRELLERLALCLGDQEGREDTGQHEESEDLETTWRRESVFIPVKNEENLTCA